MRTRIRCPLCNQLVWETTFKKGPYPLEVKAMTCKKSKGKGHGRNTFKFFRVTDPSFLQRTREFLTERVLTLAQLLQAGLIRSESSVIDTLKSRVKELEEEVKWLKSSDALIQTATPGSTLTITESYVNPKRNAIPTRERISVKSSVISSSA